MMMTILQSLLIAGPIYYLGITLGALLLGDIQIGPEIPLLVRVQSLGVFAIVYPAHTLMRMWRGTHVRLERHDIDE